MTDKRAKEVAQKVLVDWKCGPLGILQELITAALEDYANEKVKEAWGKTEKDHWDRVINIAKSEQREAEAKIAEEVMDERMNSPFKNTEAEITAREIARRIREGP